MLMNAIHHQPAGPTSVLFVCDDNRRYSLLREALVRARKIDGLRAFSAGLNPADKADPFTLSALTLAGVGSDGLWPKHWDGVAHPYRKIVDIVVIIGENTAQQLPRSFPGEPAFIVWDFDTSNIDRLNGGVWRDIQLLNPYVDAFVEGLQSGQHTALESEALAAE